MAARQPFAGAEKVKEARTVEQQAGNDAPQAGIVFIFNMFFHQGLLFIYSIKAVSVPPIFEQSSLLGVDKTIRGNVGMDGRPANGQRAEPKGELGDCAVGQRLELMNPHEDRERGQLFQNGRIVVKVGHGRKGSADNKLILKYVHSQKYTREGLFL